MSGVAGRPYAGIYGTFDEQGHEARKPLASSRLGRKFRYKAIQGEHDATKWWIRDNRQKLEFTRAAIRKAMRTCCFAEEFVQAMRRAGLPEVFHRSTQHGDRIYGVTFTTTATI